MSGKTVAMIGENENDSIVKQPVFFQLFQEIPHTLIKYGKQVVHMGPYLSHSGTVGQVWRHLYLARIT